MSQMPTWAVWVAAAGFVFVVVVIVVGLLRANRRLDTILQTGGVGISTGGVMVATGLAALSTRGCVDPDGEAEYHDEPDPHVRLDDLPDNNQPAPVPHTAATTAATTAAAIDEPDLLAAQFHAITTQEDMRQLDAIADMRAWREGL